MTTSMTERSVPSKPRTDREARRLKKTTHCADRKARHFCARRCSRAPELHGRGLKNLGRQRSLGVAVFRKRLTSPLWRPRVVHRERLLRGHVCNKVAIASEVRVEDVCRSDVWESSGAFDSEMWHVIYKSQESNDSEDDRTLFPTQVLTHAAEFTSTSMDHRLA